MSSPLRSALATAALFAIGVAVAPLSAFAQDEEAPRQPGGPRAFSFDKLVATPNLWSLSQDQFQAAAAGLPFAWTSEARDSARASQGAMSLFGLPLVEVIARFEGGKLGGITVNIYARGDVGVLTRESFERLVQVSNETLTKATKAPCTVRGKDPNGAVNAEGMIWKTATSQYLLEYSATKDAKVTGVGFRPEFVRIEITPPPKGASGLLSATSTSRPHFIGTAHIQRNAATGDIWLKDVPMVDQGQKGYCVVAATERVMRYYGADVDANELAQMSNSNAATGTHYEVMVEALKKVAAKLKVRVREIEKVEPKAVLAMIKDYNREAKKAGAKEIPDPGMMIDLGRVYSSMKGPVLRDARTRNPGELARFEATVRQNIDKGVPLLWTVYLGLFPEPGVPQSGGGHMRLIIGYNPKTKDVLFSDSWGAGHELKRMSLADAWTITTGMACIEVF